MKKYYINNNIQPNGDHEVHHDECHKFPSVPNRTFLGVFANCKDAVKTAKNYYTQVNGCIHCCNECHTQ